LVKFLDKIIKKTVVSFNFNLKQLYLTLRKPEDILFCALFFKNQTSLKFEQLLDIWAVDNLLLTERFVVYYKFTSLKFAETLICRFSLKLNQEAFSLLPYYSSANWLERETWDMFGIIFVNHFDLRRILTDYGFWGFPLRKDFPLVGYLEVKYDLDLGKVVIVPVEMLQEYRFFDFLSPWHN